MTNPTTRPRVVAHRASAFRRALAAPLEVFAWAANDPAMMDRLIAWEVTGIVTDRPDLLRNRLAK